MGWKRKIKDGLKIFGSSGWECCVLKWERGWQEWVLGRCGQNREFSLVCVTCELLIKQPSGKVQGILGYVIILGILDM